MQTDDAYGDVDPYGFGDRSCSSPTRPSGGSSRRPARSPTSSTTSSRPAASSSVDTGLVTGYDFLTDGADAIADAADPTYGADLTGR